MALPKYAKESKETPDGTSISKCYLSLLKLLKGNISGKELLFEKLPKAFGFEEFHDNLADNLIQAKLFYDNYLILAKNELARQVKEKFILPENRTEIHAMSLASVIKDWCESLNPSVFEQLFTDGTERCLGLFKSISNDDDFTITRLAKLATDLRLEDWDERVREKFFINLQQYKQTAESYQDTAAMPDEMNGTNVYQITFVDEKEGIVTKRFNRIEETGRGQLLYTQITSALSSWGRSVSEQEKRQVLMEILKELC